MKKFFAFTLSELLITLSVIGVISALTIPTLIKNYQKEAQTVQIRKLALDLVDAADMITTAEAKSRFASTSVFTDDDGIDNFLNQYFRLVRVCDSTDVSSCFFSGNYKTIDGNVYGNKTAASYCNSKAYMLENSATICISIVRANSGPMIDINAAYKPYLKILADTNGPEKPNIGGRDMFTFYLTKDGELRGKAPSAFAGDAEGNLCNTDGVCNNCTSSPNGAYCLNRLLSNNWEMNY